MADQRNPSNVVDIELLAILLIAVVTVIAILVELEADALVPLIGVSVLN